jgi:hypothetical protein
MHLRSGARLKSAVCTTEVIVVRAPATEVDLRCGGRPMYTGDAAASSGGEPTEGPGTLLGKRYADEAAGLEVLCTRPGAGSLSIGDQPIGVKDAKAMPASD